LNSVAKILINHIPAMIQRLVLGNGLQLRQPDCTVNITQGITTRFLIRHSVLSG